VKAAEPNVDGQTVDRATLRAHHRVVMVEPRQQHA
jgi:hypothetical protein